MSARELITEHLDLWTGAVTKKSSSGRGSNGKVELTGLKKLRELILELALSGKLVEAEESDKPAHQLLSTIESEKARLAAEKIIKKPKKLEAASGDEPYQIPSHWCWVRLGQVTNYGVTDKAEPNQVADTTWVLELEDIKKESSRLLKKVHYTERQFKSSKNRFERGDVLYGKLRPYLDKVLVADGPGVCTTEIIPIRGYLGLLPEFLRLVLKSPNFKRYANDSTHGMNLPRLGTDKARLAMIPLAPEQEQHRIVQKVDELMALCDRLEKQTSDQLEAHETLVDTLLGTLTQSESATELADNWARLAAHFNTLFTTEQSIDKLKQTILQLAVMGRLVEQDAGDEPAPTLLKQIALEIAKEAKLGSARKRSQQNGSTKGPAPFNLPYGWCWERLEDLTSLITKGSSPKWQGVSYTNKGEGTLFITSENVDRYRLKLKNEKFVENRFNDIQPRSQLRKGDILMNIVGASIGRTAIYDLKESANINQAVCLIRTPVSGMSREFLLYFFNSSVCLSYMFDQQVDNARANLSMSNIAKFLIPVPPKEEQNRIVQKVDELMALCDQLKERLSQASATHCQMAEAVVEGALS